MKLLRRSLKVIRNGAVWLSRMTSYLCPMHGNSVSILHVPFLRYYQLFNSLRMKSLAIVTMNDLEYVLEFEYISTIIHVFAELAKLLMITAHAWLLVVISGISNIGCIIRHFVP